MSSRGDAAERHVPVLRDRIVDLLEPALQDAAAPCASTARSGMGGHAEAILERCPQARVIGLDRDEEALALSGERLARFGDALRRRARRLRRHRRRCSPSTRRARRWASCSTSASRRSSSTSRTAASPTGTTPRSTCGWTSPPASPPPTCSTPTAHGDLARVLKTYGEERFAGRIASAVVREREKEPFTSSARLVEVLRGAVPAASQRTGGHPAKRTFQALRIEVNAELEVLGARRRLGHRGARARWPDRGAVVPLARGPHHQAGVRRRSATAAPRTGCRSSCPSTPRTCACSPAAPRCPTSRSSTPTPDPPRPGCAPPNVSSQRTEPDRMSQLAPVRPLPRTSPRRAAPTPRQLKVVAPPEVRGNGVFLALCVTARCSAASSGCSCSTRPWPRARTRCATSSTAPTS